MPTSDEKLADIHSRAQELDKQLRERAKLYSLMKAPEIADEFERLADVEVKPILQLSTPNVELYHR